jgi:carboxypeptidase C (cathepsin A)
MKKLSLIIIFFVFLNYVYTVDETVLPDFPYDKVMHSGYLDLASNPLKKLHYILVDSERDPSNDPVVLWLNGGPGCSSLEGFSVELGPASFIPGSTDATVNPHRWNKNANVIFLESPAGVGFSYNDDPNDRNYEDVKAGKENLEAMVSFFNKFPELRKNKFYITGESYAGIYIPHLAKNIVEHNKKSVDTQKINLIGFMVGNGVVDWTLDADTGGATNDYAYTHALYGEDLRDEYKRNCLNNETKSDLKCRATQTKINHNLRTVNAYNIYETCLDKKENFLNSIPRIKRDKFWYTPFLKIKQDKSPEYLSYLADEFPACDDDIGPYAYFRRKDVQIALNVRTDLQPWETCADINYYIDHSTGTIGLYPDLLKENLKIFIFSGDADAVVPFNGTEKWIKKLGLKAHSSYTPYYVPDQSHAAGFYVKFEGLTFITIRGAGHMVPQTKPDVAEYVLSQFLNDKDL